MTKVESIRNHLQAMRGLEDLTYVLEQTAAQKIAQLREDVLHSRQYFQAVWKIYGILKQLAPPPPEVMHKHLVVVISVDGGMSGGLTHKVIAEALKIREEHGADALVAGKSAHSSFRNDGDKTTHFFSVPKNVTLEDIKPIYKIVAGYAQATVVYPMFESLSRQKVVAASFSIKDGQRLKDSSQSKNADTEQMPREDAERFIVDPDAQAMVNYLNEAVVGLTLHNYFAESVLAYSASQMIAMRNGHDNAEKEVEKDTLLFNKARRELIDIKLREVYGARAVHRGAIRGR